MAVKEDCRGFVYEYARSISKDPVLGISYVVDVLGISTLSYEYEAGYWLFCW